MKLQNLIHIVIGIICIGLLPRVQAVVPAPDGGYPNGNTAKGQNALHSLTSGGYNTAIGFLSLYSDTQGSFNTAIGAATLLANTGDDNTATGGAALLFNTTGFNNTANGSHALYSNTTGVDNTATGHAALYSNTIGAHNVANGDAALLRNTTGNNNTANGYEALFNNRTGNENTANGYQALFNNTTSTNTATGFKALFNNTTGPYNTANGYQALYSNTSGHHNTAVGIGALLNNTTGSANIALGPGAGAGQTTGDNNIYIGFSMEGFAGETNACHIGNIYGQTSASGIPVLIGSDSKLGTSTSSKRFKDDIKPMDKASEALFELKPVTFHYKKELDSAGIQQFGLVAEEVQKVNSALIVLDKEGKPYSVRYDQVNAMLLNEFLKEHKKVEEQQATIAQLKKDFGATVAQLNARLDEQAAQIQRVSAQLEASKPAAQMVNNNQ